MDDLDLPFFRRIYDKAGNSISILEWGRLRQDQSYAIIGRDRVAGADVSTVWLGLDHNWGEGPPQLFETMIFYDTHQPIVFARYNTELEAQAGHVAAVGYMRESSQAERDQLRNGGS